MKKQQDRRRLSFTKDVIRQLSGYQLDAIAGGDKADTTFGPNTDDTTGRWTTGH